MSKRTRIFIALGIAVLVGGIYLWFFGVQTMSSLMVRYTYRDVPDASKTPAPLLDSSISSVPHKRMSYSGYEFEVPWDDIDEQKGRTAGTIRVIAFASGNAFWFSTFPPKQFVNTVVKSTKLDSQSIRELYGDDAFASDYAFHQKMLQITPSEITPFIPRRKAIAGQMLLLIKALSMPKATSEIFAIHGPGFDGFQFENPQSRPFRISDELFSDDGGVELIFFQKVGGGAPAISQAEINRIVRSIRKIPTSGNSK
jgi:hypothetical protein